MASRRRRKNITPAEWEPYGIPRDFVETAVSLYRYPEDARRRWHEYVETREKVRTTVKAVEAEIQLFPRSQWDWISTKLAEVSRDQSAGLPPATCCDYGTLLPNLLRSFSELLRLEQEFQRRREGITAAADKELAQTRALAWLFLAVQRRLRVSKYQASEDVVERMSQTKSAEVELDGDGLRARMRRFKGNHRREYEQN